PDDPPIGVPIATLTNDVNGAVVIDNKPVPNTTDRNGVFIVVINRETRAIEQSGTAPRSTAGLDQLAGIIKPYSGTDGFLVVLSSTHGVEASAIGKLNGVTKSLGAPDFSPDDQTKIG